jgi:hypothetical protein
MTAETGDLRAEGLRDQEPSLRDGVRVAAATKLPRATCECGKAPRAIGVTRRVDGRHMSAYLVFL